MNNKRIVYFILLILILISTGCEKGEAYGNDTLIIKDYDNVYKDRTNNYKIDVELDFDNYSYSGEQWTTYVNNTDVDLDEIYFHLYPNAFKSLETAPILFSQVNENPISYDEGFINIKSISIGTVDLDYEIDKEVATILKVKLDKKLLSGEKTIINLKYNVKLPSAKDRFGYGEEIINLGNWYPIACVYDDNGWNLDPYYKLGDPFYSDISNYQVTIKSDKDIVIASSGNILQEEVLKTHKKYHIEGKLIRDFAWAASPDFNVLEKESNGTKIKLYYRDKNSTMAKRSLIMGEDALNTFSKLFGKYPYGQYSIVMTEFPSGMEYPGLVFIGEDFFSPRYIDILEQIIVHETAHQWWYGLVGNNQVKEAWLDEALTTYSEVLYNDEIYGKDKGKDYFIQNIKIGYEYGKTYLGEDEIVNKPLDKFYSWDDYGILVYTKGAMFINQIKEEYGREVLLNILKTYFERYKFANATTEDFIGVCEEITGNDFTEIVNTWLY